MNLAEAHQFFDTNSFTFSKKNEAQAVVFFIGGMLRRRFDMPPAAIEVTGKKGHFQVEFPRAKLIWMPVTLSVEGLAAEIARIANELNTIYERVDVND